MNDQKSRRWVFLRGLARHSQHWGHFVERFKETFPHDEVELLDARGNGTEAHIPSYVSMEANVRDLRARSLILKKGPVHLLSISLGSMIAIEWEFEFPEEVASLICINTSDSTNSRFYDRLRPQNYARILNILLNSDNNQKAERNIMQMVAPKCPEPDYWIQEFSKSPQTSRENLIRQLYAAITFKLPSKPPHCPAHIFVGREDAFVSPKCSERIAKMWGVQPVYHPSAGHDIPLEDPQWVCDQIKLQVR